MEAAADPLPMKGGKMQKETVSTREHFSVYSGFIILRFSPEMPLPSNKCNSLLDATKAADLHELEKILTAYKLSGSSRLIRSMAPEKILQLEKKAAETKLPPLHSLTAYWRVDARHQMVHMEEITKQMNKLYAVDLAYEELDVSQPMPDSPGDRHDYNIYQEYLNAAPVGIDARWAWEQPHGKGAGIGFVDLEQGWRLSHEDYKSRAPQEPLYGDNRDFAEARNHGAAVLGVVVANHDSKGVNGIAPLASVNLTSHYRKADQTYQHVADAIIGAWDNMGSGDILLIEVQRSSLPVERDDADFDAIRLATANGRVVIEAAGNGDSDLDDLGLMDSGAIMIGGGKKEEPHNRWHLSNYGSRIDCYAWGHHVTTCGYGDKDDGARGGGDPNENRAYTDRFKGTSSASAIIAGAALILQGMYFQKTGLRYSPQRMRELLSCETTGTSSGDHDQYPIGVMPDLSAIIKKEGI